jgi:multiple sugar transport system ATP-binding protein
MNLVEAAVGGGAVEFGGFRIPLPALLGDTLPPGRVVLGIRPEGFEDAAFADPSLPQIDVVVKVVEELGSDSHVIFPIDAPRIDTEELRETREGEDESLLAGDQAVFNARVDPRTTASAGASLRLAVDPTRFHFFDQATGENLALRREPSAGAERLEQRAGSVVRH